MCLVCPEHQIKSFPGDTENCTSCDGESNVSNAGHTACGKTKNIFKCPLVLSIFVVFCVKYMFCSNGR